MLPHSLGGLIQQNIIAVFFLQVSMLLFLLPSFLGLLCFRLVNGSWCNERNLLLVFLWHVHPEEGGRNEMKNSWVKTYLRASGTAIPVSVWFISRRTQMTLVTAQRVELSMWQYSVAAFIFFV